MMAEALRIKAIFPERNQTARLESHLAKLSDVILVDAETGRPLPHQDVRINCPLKGVVTADVRLVLCDIEVQAGKESSP